METDVPQYISDSCRIHTLAEVADDEIAWIGKGRTAIIIVKGDMSVKTQEFLTEKETAEEFERLRKKYNAKWKRVSGRHRF